MREQTDRLNYSSGQKQSLDFNSLIAEYPTKQHQTKHFIPAVESTPQSREPHGMDADVTPMNIDSRDDSTPPYIPPLPENVLRTRCYRLNLDSEINLYSTQKHHVCMGPFAEPPPFLTSASSDESLDVSPITVAIQTAQIFRGITVSRDGTILSQNARATRSNRGAQKTKRGEKSRQAAKIDKAHDLVEESAIGISNNEEEAKLVSLFIVGEYDDMKYLVRDGSKKLRESEGLPDDVLLSINRLRPHQQIVKAPTPTSTRSRRHSSMSPSQSGPTTPVTSPKSSSVISSSAPPKLKSNPRDTRRNREGLRMRLDSCNDFMVQDPSRRGGVDDGSDWAHAWNIWNCGAGTASPLQPSSPNRVVYEGRDTAYSNNRETGLTSRVG